MTRKVAAQRAAPKHSPHLAVLSLGALGVVFGDIGTSPLYALRQCFQTLRSSSVDPAAVMGILSLVLWSLILVVCLKYVTFIMRADHDGEGGILAMLALIHTEKPPPEASFPNRLILLVLFGAALLFGDGVITPSISVLSAIEGLKIASASTQKLIVPLSLGILIGLFLLQKRGTGQVGFLFGPIMVLWFLTMAALGVAGIVQDPRVLAAINPWDAAAFMFHHGWTGFLVLGGVVLCFSGAEALFADLSHFGRKPIVLGWYTLVLPSLLLNYFGQGALALGHPDKLGQPFSALVPKALLYPMVALATAATVIASQALISGVFTLTQQAIHMGYFPRFEIVHTSKDERGQVYLAFVNYALMAACVFVVLAFQSSARLGGAYGLAVIGTMTVTSLTYFVVMRDVWHRPKWVTFPLVGCFLVIDGAFLAGNLAKILEGAWVPLVFAAAVFAVFWIWSAGRARYHRDLFQLSMPINDFCREMKKWKSREDGTAIFLTLHPDSVPLVGATPWLLQHARYAQILLITVVEATKPYVSEDDVIKTELLAPNFWRITASFGFMQHPDMTRVLESASGDKLKIDWEKLVCYLPQPTLAPKRNPWKQYAQEIYEFLSRNSLSPAKYFRVPPREIIHVGVRLDAR